MTAFLKLDGGQWVNANLILSVLVSNETPEQEECAVRFVGDPPDKTTTYQGANARQIIARIRGGQVEYKKPLFDLYDSVEGPSTPSA